MMRHPIPAGVLAALLTAPVAVHADALLDRIAAIVDGRVITQSEVDERVSLSRAAGLGTGLSELEMQKLSLRDLIDELLLDTEISRQQIEITEGEIDQAVSELQRQNGLSPEQFEQALAMQGYTLDGYRKEVRSQLERARLLNLEVRSKVEITDEDVRSLMAQRESTEGFEVRARHILIKAAPDADEATVAAARAKAVAARVRVVDGGEAFADVAMEVSEDGTASGGGDLGWFGRGLMVEPFEKAAFAAEPGTITEPVRTAFGWHIIRVEARREKTAKALEREMQAVRARLYEQATGEQTRRYLDSLRKRSVVQYRIAELSP